MVPFGGMLPNGGTCADIDVSATGKLSDDDINVIAAPLNGFQRTYMMKAQGVHKFMFLRTNQHFDDTKP